MKVSSLFVKYVMKDSQRFLAGGMSMKRVAAALLTILLGICRSDPRRTQGDS